MPKLTIDQREVEVPEGATILDAARKLGIDVPALCYREDCRASTSCLVCLVKNGNGGKLVPSCATLAVEGMRIESETDEVHELRRSALELLLGDHLGDCLAPCYFACPAHMDIPQMLRQIEAGHLGEAIATVKSDIALPAVLGRICPAPCEKACRRKAADAPVAICRLKQFAADEDLAGPQPYLPAKLPDSGKRVAIIGAGPAGLAAAWFLLQQGHACTIFDENDKPGGRLHHEFGRDELPADVIERDVAPILQLGAELRLNARVGDEPSLAGLRKEFDALLIACGAGAKQQAEAWPVEVAARGIKVEKGTYRTDTEGVFAAGNAVRGKALVVRSVADGKEAAAAIGQFLGERPVEGQAKPFNTRIGSVDEGEMAAFLQLAGKTPRHDPPSGPDGGYTSPQASLQAGRCLHCDCRGLDKCLLRKYAAVYGADPRRHKIQRREFLQDARHAEVIYEPGKCIDCGLCVQIASRAEEPLGLTFIGRGFDVRIGVPLGGSLAEALHKVAVECAKVCPTGALVCR